MVLITVTGDHDRPDRLIRINGIRNVANEMDQEDGLVWVYGPADDGVMAFTDFGIETLTGIIEIYKASPDLLKRSTDPE